MHRGGVRLDQDSRRTTKDQVPWPRSRRMGLCLRGRRLQSGAAAETHGAGRLMAKAPAFAKAFTGRWRIVEMDVWENDFLDLVEEAHLTFRGQVRWRNCLRRSQGLPGRTLRHPRRFGLRGVLMGRARRE